MVPASDDSQTNSCLKTQSSCVLGRGTNASVSAGLARVGLIGDCFAFPLKINYGDDVLVLPLQLLLLQAHHP